MEKPRLRPIQAVPMRDGGRVIVQIFDPARISDKVLAVPQETMFLLSLFDGTRSMVDIQAELMRRTGDLVFSSDIQSIIEQLDEALLLDSDHFRTHVRELEEAYRNSPVRKACSAGNGYPADASKLRAQIDGYFAAEDLSVAPSPAPSDARLVGVVAPHIDLERGGPSYAHAYAALAAGAADAELFVVFGTAHFSSDALFILTRKSFQTPLGTMRTNAELVDAVAERAGGDFFRSELVHANEHSIEFQVIFLQRLFADRPVEILPILCGSTDSAVAGDQCPRDVEEVAAFLEAVRSVAAESGKRVCTIAAADLAHVGAHFGDDFALTPTVMQDVERADRDALAHVEQLDPDGFYHSVHADDNARHICGVASIYALLATAGATRCELLDYRQAVDGDVGRAVTFAALALYS